MLNYNLDILNDYIEKGLIEKNNHPSLPISIYNYSRKCSFNKAWDDITLNMRGTIIDYAGNVIARSFPKFFNMEELNNIPNEPFEVFEKLDGSLGILFFYGGEWHLATKGSFTSDQAIKAKEILKRDYYLYWLNKETTYLFEIIYPENRIVCNYGDEEKLILIGALSNKDNYEYDHKYLCVTANLMFPNNQEKAKTIVVKRYDGIEDYKQLKEIIKNDQEGFVVRFKSGLRMKIKGEEYVRLHRLLTNFSNVDIWECLKNKTDINQLLEKVPDEFDIWVRKTIKELNYVFYQIEEYCGKIYNYFRFGKYNDIYPEPTKKEFALHIQKYINKNLHGIMFAMWDGNREKWEQLIWKLIKPKYQKPFWNKTEDK